MWSENKKETQMAVRHNAIVMQDSYLCFTRATGGDIRIEKGDKITIIVETAAKKAVKSKEIKHRHNGTT